jgi:hypothetical protein
MSPNSAAPAQRPSHDAERRSAELRERAAALLAIARRIVHDARNSRLQAQLVRRMRK